MSDDCKKDIYCDIFHDECHDRSYCCHRHHGYYRKHKHVHYHHHCCPPPECKPKECPPPEPEPQPLVADLGLHVPIEDLDELSTFEQFFDEIKTIFDGEDIDLDVSKAVVSLDEGIVRILFKVKEDNSNSCNVIEQVLNKLYADFS